VLACWNQLVIMSREFACVHLTACAQIMCGDLILPYKVWSSGVDTMFCKSNFCIAGIWTTMAVSAVVPS